MAILTSQRQLDDLSRELRHRVEHREISVEEADHIWKRAQYAGDYGIGRYPREDFFADPLSMSRRVNVQPKAPAPPPFDPNTIESLNVDIETLTGLWAAKHGSKWVKDSELGEGAEAFWHHAFKRLRLHQKFEQYADWSKLKEVPNGTV